MTAITAEAGKITLPHPLVKPFKHPLRFVKNHAMLLFYAVLFAHLGEFIVAALYYLITQTTDTMNAAWHSLVPNSDLRHAIRDVGEGVLGGLLAQAIVYNYFKKSNRRVGKVTGILKRRLHIPQTLAAVFAAILLGALFFTIGYYVMALFHPTGSEAAVGGSVWHRTFTNLYATNFPQKVLGLIAAFGARKPMRVVFNNTQAWFVERKIDNNRKAHWWEPPTYRARVNYMIANPDERHVAFSVRQNIVMALACVVGVGLAGYGYYVLTYIA
jgi:hypothetical protein